ncbi:EDD domain protein [Streptococcus gallolyticus subsp. gallolyticus]|jgi:DegV family protein with EDD domain|uniref:EDD domain protein, DegV family n=2 Tax=Streptococcus gallolyticus TaxID=315405 RepID=A0A060RHS0_9STRE|nr:MULTISPECIES: DegV family protein [Streptococcus]MCF2566553.1 DegV family protein [Streptococcus pasteurianus]AQP41684.1 DegV family protein [Streptococcus gallolyticus subsp. gallolyticus DSM 16831]MCF0239670.1 DegV family protein [Streptococcus gallolyticus]MCO7178140.1 DegV family protein [Streptococcus gallolyticus]MCQ9215841.1 DegV family protein [Streptococcus gallolyticus]
MSKIKIVTDSSLTIEPELVEKYDITVIPLSVMIDGVVYSDSDLKEEGKFLNMMRNSKELPKTSQPPVGVFAEVYENLMKNGAEHIVSIHITHTLSGTVEAARQGANLAGADVTVIDSTFTDQCQKFQVVQAAKLAQEGGSLEEVIAKVEEVRQKSELYIGVSTLENLVKGGRIGRVTGLISSLLNIKVVMEMVDCELNPIIKGRGLKTFNKWLDNFIEYAKGKKVAEIGISYCGTADMANGFKEKLQVLGAPIAVLETGSIIQTHTGENAFAVMVRYE